MLSKVIYYYQTFTTLEQILKENPNVTHIHLSSIHFGYDENNKPYIHLNDNDPFDNIFINVWYELLIAYNFGIKIVLMVGGAGGAYTDLFNNFNIFYSMLLSLINRKTIISGIDLDIEEQVDINNVKMLIDRINSDLGAKDFTISIAPIQSSLEYDQEGMGGFIYKKLYKSKQGKYIDYFNVQCYSDYSVDAYDRIIKNGYPPEKIVMGMISSQDFDDCLKVAAKLSYKYKKFGGVFNWEYFDSPPNSGKWSDLMYNAINNLKINKKKSKHFLCC